MLVTVRVDSQAGRALRRGRPWVFSNQVRGVEGSPAAGEVVRVVQGASGPGRELGVAFYNPHSLIALRRVSDEVEDVDRALLERRLRQAWSLRERLFPESDAWRLCHGEADLLPGLIVDRYADVHVVQSLAAGMERLLSEVVAVLRDAFGARSVVERNESALRRLEGLEERRGVLFGEDPGRLEVRVPPLRMLVEPLAGQKTGAFLDQRENQAAAARLGRGTSVYEGHCNAGGFGLHAALAGAESVVGVDSSEQALALARENAALNGVGSTCTFERADVPEDLDARHRRRERFGLVVLDPPSFTRSKKQLPQARRALRDLNRRGMTLVEPGGFLVSSCCSHHVSEQTFVEQLQRAAQDAGRVLRLLEVRGAAPDHPVLASLPEGRYLTCVLAQVT